MLSHGKLREYASFHNVAVRDISNHSGLTTGHIYNVFNGQDRMTEEVYQKIVKAINAVYAASVAGENAVSNNDKGIEPSISKTVDNTDHKSTPRPRGRKRTEK